MKQLPALARVFSYLSILSVGGGMAAFPELNTLAESEPRDLEVSRLEVRSVLPPIPCEPQQEEKEIGEIEIERERSNDRVR